ncbi:MAG: ComEC/Rec2 family competence protein [Candidatus Omnitrophica bacterium]|nr:ComEC/Rec2 family competence protein [Candidatus Omnitrophota bacterium]
MVLGEKRNVPPLINNVMMKTGTVHVLVVSGFNVGIVAFITNLLLKLLRLKRKPRIVFTILFVITYCFMTGASNPVLRATIMAIFFLSGYLIKREPDVYYSLSLAALFILSLNPLQLFDIGFQLSFASVFAIIFLYPRLKKLIRIEKLKFPAGRYIVDNLLVSFSAWIGTAGIILANFRIFSPITVLANIFVVPLATLITLCGFGLIFTQAIGFLNVIPFAPVLELLVNMLLKVNIFLSNLPAAWISF